MPVRRRIAGSEDAAPPMHEALQVPLENVLFWHLKRTAKDLTYYHDEKDRECDFIVEKDDGLFSAIQVCHELTDDNKNREFDGLAAALKRFGLKSGVIVTHAQSDLAIHDGCEILIVPVTEYLVDPKISR